MPLLFESKEKKEYLPFSLLPQGIPRGALVEIIGIGKTDLVSRFLSENPQPLKIWIEEEFSIYPCALAQKKVSLEKIIFSTDDQNTDQADPAITDTYFILLDLYHLAWQSADKVQNNRLAAYALLGTAEVNRWRGEYHAAIRDYEKAVESFTRMKTSQEPDNLLLVTACIDLAQLYALHNLDFIKAEESLNKIPSLLKIIQDAGQSLDAKQVILRKYDFFLGKMAVSQYSNSHFASQARIMREQLTNVLNIDQKR